MAFTEYYDSENGTDNKEELKPCPFCGSHDVAIKENDVGDTWAEIIRYFVECNDCGAECGDSAIECIAVRKWNDRAGSTSNPSCESTVDII